MKKSYKGFIIWLILFTVGITGIGFLPFGGMGVELMVRLIECLSLVACTVLMYMIYRTEAVYWFTGINYEQALQAGSARRRLYALKHLKLFGIYTAVFSVFEVIMQLLGVPIVVDTVIFVVTIFGVSVKTMFYKL